MYVTSQRKQESVLAQSLAGYCLPLKEAGLVLEEVASTKELVYLGEQAYLALKDISR